MKLLILESFCYELHVFYWYYMFHLKLNLYVTAFPTVVIYQLSISKKTLLFKADFKLQLMHLIAQNRLHIVQIKVFRLRLNEI